MIKIIMLTGFLGAGKTTLLKSLLESYSDKKVAVIVNEFGEVNIDSRLVEAEGIEMAELSNGSIFCACIKDKFVDSLIAMSTTDADYLFIEASGLADPANMGQILDGIKVKTNDNYDLLGSIVVIDAQSFSELSEMLPALQYQAEYAGVAIINKADLVDDEQLKATEKKLREFNENINAFVTSYCNVDVDELVNSFVVNETESRESSNTVESRPSTFVLKSNEVIKLDDLRKFLEAIAPDTYRIKGFAQTDNGNVELSCVLDNININKWNENVDMTQIVVISSVGFKMLSEIIKASNEYVGGVLKI